MTRRELLDLLKKQHKTQIELEKEKEKNLKYVLLNNVT